MTEKPEHFLPGDVVEMTKSLDLAERIVGNLLADMLATGDDELAGGDIADRWLTIVRKTLSTPRAELIERPER
jgi:hypothetical protein